MPNVFGIPEVSVQDVAHKRAESGDLILIDVRERSELRLANLGEGILWIPLSELAAKRLEALPEAMQNKDQEIIVFCHTGVRSAQVAAWLQQQGWTNVWNMEGGIDAYARQVDASVGTY